MVSLRVSHGRSKGVLPSIRPTAMPEFVPTRAGKVLRLAAMSWPPAPGEGCSWLKSKTKYESSGRRVKRSAALKGVLVDVSLVRSQGEEDLRVCQLELGCQAELRGATSQVTGSGGCEGGEGQDGGGDRSSEKHGEELGG